MMTSKMLNVCCGTGLQATTKINVHSTAENNTVHMNIIKNVNINCIRFRNQKVSSSRVFFSWII